MAGCETKPKPPGDHDAWLKAILKWAGGAAAIAAILAYLNIAGGGPITWTGGAASVALAAIIVAAMAAAVLGGFIGYAVEWSRRLKVQNPRTITVCALVSCAGTNSGIPPFNDGDWTFNVTTPWAVTDPQTPPLSIAEIRNRAAPDSGLPTAYETTDPNDGNREVFHVEISSKIGDFGSVGGAIGSAAGTIGGIIAGAAICVAAGLLTFGLALALCALIVAALALGGAIVGGFGGAAIGGGIGWIADQFSDFDTRGKSVERGCQMFLTGRWVTDLSHQHNEIHDLEAAVICECGITSTSSTGLEFGGMVGTGRHPSGPDP